MAFTVSPSVSIKEIDLSLTIPSITSSPAGIAGVFRWGPIDQLVLVDRNNFSKRFGKPADFNAETWFAADSFLAYSAALYVSRAANTTGFSNTVTANITSGTSTLTFSGGGSGLGVSAGMKVYGEGIPTGAVVSSTNTTVVVISSNVVTSGNNVTLTFTSANAAFNAIGNTGAVTTVLSNYTIKNKDHFDTVDFSAYDADALFVARYAGAIGNSLRVAVCDNQTAYSSNVDLRAINADVNDANTKFSVSVGSNTATFFFYPASSLGSNTADFKANVTATHATTALGKFTLGDLIEFGNSSIGKQLLKITTLGSVTYETSSGSNTGSAYFTVGLESPYSLSTAYSSNTASRFWEFYKSVDRAPATSTYVAARGNTSAKDELHVVVVDAGGEISGVSGTILEIYQGVSRATDAKGEAGSVAYYQTLINENSSYIYVVQDRSTSPSANAALVASSTATTPLRVNFVMGSDGDNEVNAGMSILSKAWDKFASAEDVDVSFLITGKSKGTNGTEVVNYIVDNIAEVRKDLVVFASPEYSDVVNNSDDVVDDVVEWGGYVSRSSYVFKDSGYKQMYDRFNDVYRWVPLCGDMAGLAARTDITNDPWWSPAGLNRGVVKNVVKLAWNPKESQRDLLWKADVNPVTTFQGSGVILFGDKMGLNKNSTFNIYNVRRLFIVLEKAIATASKFFLFEHNDEFTRQQYRTLVDSFLRDVQGRRGILDYRVVCDSTNNTDEVIARRELVADIYIKPSVAIAWIGLNFVNVRGNISFTERTTTF